MFVAVDETTAASIRRPANTPLINSVSVTKVGQDRRNDKQYLRLSRLERHIRPDTDSCHELYGAAPLDGCYASHITERIRV